MNRNFYLEDSEGWYCSSLKEVRQTVVKVISSGGTVLLVRKTSIDTPDFYLVVSVPYFIYRPDPGFKEFGMAYNTIEDLTDAIDSFLEKLGDITYASFYEGNFFANFQYFHERSIDDIFNFDQTPLWQIQKDIVNMQMHFRKQYLVKTALCFHYDLNYWESMELIKVCGLDIPDYYKNLEEYINSYGYKGKHILDAINSDPDDIDY